MSQRLGMLGRLGRVAGAGVASAVLVRSLQNHALAERPPSDASASLPSASELAGLGFRGQYRGHLSPPLPEAGASKTPTGPVVHDACGISWQRGSYGSWWLRLGLGGPLPSRQQVGAALDLVLARATADKAAVYVCVQELEAEPSVTAELRARGFRYHHFAPHEQRAKTAAGGSGYGVGEHVYYRWMGNQSHDMVPSYATSIEGVGGLILSPDEQKVLLVWEYGNWKHVGGAVDEGESCLTTLAREVSEEVGLVVDERFAPIAVGGWQLSRSRDDVVNDNFRTFVVRALSENFQLDQMEIGEARWFRVSDLIEVWRGAGTPDPFDVATVPASSTLAAAHGLAQNRRAIGSKTLDWLSCYTKGEGQTCSTSESNKGRSRMVYVGGRR